MAWEADGGINKKILRILTRLSFALAIIFLSSNSYAGHYDECSPVPVDPKTWANKFIDDISARRFDEVADYTSANMCIPKSQLRHVFNLISSWQETEGNISYKDLIQEVNLGSTLRKLVYAIQSEGGEFLFVEFKFWKFRGNFVAYQFNIEDDIEEFIPDW